MKIEPTETARGPRAAGERRMAPGSFALPEAGRSDLWGLYYGALWLVAVLLAAVVVLPRVAGERGWIEVACWGVGLGLIALLGAVARPLIHDLLVGLNHRERLGVGLFAGVLFLAPGVFRRPTIIPDGFLWTMPLLLLLPVTPSLARRVLLVMLAGGWFAALWVNDLSELGWLLAFAVAWLAALGLTHVTFVADAHGLRGRWPAARLVGSALAAALPAAGAGVLAWWFWPRGGLASWGPPASPGADRPRPLADRMSTMDLTVLFYQTMIYVVAIVLLLVALYLLRRWLLKRRPSEGAELGMPGQEARLEYTPEPARARRRALAGARGRLVRQWGRWAAALGREFPPRGEGETAAEFAVRVAAALPDATPPPELTALLERAHYSPESVTESDVERMHGLVLEELSRQSLRRQAPMEDAD